MHCILHSLFQMPFVIQYMMYICIDKYNFQIWLISSYYMYIFLSFPFSSFYNCNLGCNLSLLVHTAFLVMFVFNGFQCHQQSLKHLKTKPSMRVIVFNWLVRPAVNRLQPSHGPRMDINWAKLWTFKTATELILGHMCVKLKTKWHKWQQVHRLQCSVSLKDLFLYGFNAVPCKTTFI